MISSSLRLAVETGCGRVVVNAWHLADRMEEAVRGAGQPPGVAVRVSRESALMGTAGGLALARDRGLLDGEGPVLVINGDGLLNLSLEPLLERHAAAGDWVTLGLLPHLDPARWSRVLLDGKGLVSDILAPGRPGARRPPSSTRASWWSHGAPSIPSPPPRTASAGASGRPPARPVGWAEWCSAVTGARWAPRPITSRPPCASSGTGRRIHPSARVHPGASLGTAFVGPGARIEADAVVGDAVVGKGAVVRRGARVIRSVLLGSVEAGEGDCVVDEYRALPSSD